MKLTIYLFITLLFVEFAYGCAPQNKISSSNINLQGGKTTTVLPFELIDNRIFVNVKINGRKELRFLFDSGASNMIVPEAARELGLKLEEPFEQSGAGEKTVEAWRTSVARLEAGDICAANQKFNVFSVDPIVKAIGFRHFDGIIGFQIFSRFVVKVDYERNLLTFTEPDKFSYRGKGKTIPFEFYGHIPQVEAEIDGVRDKFIVDTGDRSSLTLFVPFVEKNDLRKRYAPRVEMITGWGLGGPIPAQVTRRPVLKLDDDLTAQNIVVRLPVMKSGGFVRDDLAGSIGTGVLKRFNVVFDYSRRRLIFEKNKNYANPDTFDGAGMWLSQQGQFFEVMSVAAGSPAEKAGIKAGEKIIAINGRQTKELFLPTARRMLHFTGNRATLELTVESENKSRKVLLTLESLV